MSTTLQKESWSGKCAFILSTLGAAVGLGNIWKFPYEIAHHGGSAFLILYIAFTLIMGLPILFAELFLGKRKRKTLIGTFEALHHNMHTSRFWMIIPYMGLFTLFLVISFYSVVSGWSVYYLFHSFSFTTPENVPLMWADLLTQPSQTILYHVLFAACTMFFVARGVSRGLELLNNILMPLLFLILIALVLMCMFSEHYSIKNALLFLFSFDAHKITAGTVMSALGQSFFTLAIGAGAMLVYGSYLKEDDSIVASATIIALLQLLVALLAGTSIFAIALSSDHSIISQGPGMMFLTLPTLLLGVSYGKVMIVAFFLSIFFAGLTSAINIVEPLVTSLCDKMQISRGRASAYIFVLLAGSGSVVSLSFNVLSNVHLWGTTNLFDAVIDIATLLLTIGGLLYALYVGWVLPEHYMKEEFKGLGNWAHASWLCAIRYIVPVGILLMLVTAK